MLKVANSVINASQITGVLPVVNGGTGVTTSTGTGNTVLSAAPTLSGNVNLSTGNLIIGTAGKGIDFSITGEGSGTMTSELLADYEEGTWTPTNIGGSLVVVGAFTSSGTYTKVGKLVTVQGTLNGATSVAISGGANVVCGGLPFSAASGTLCPGTAINGGATASAVLYANSGTSVGSVTALAASTTIFFSITYFV
jgi:filamentous hemagglutinin